MTDFRDVKWEDRPPIEQKLLASLSRILGAVHNDPEKERLTSLGEMLSVDTSFIPEDAMWSVVKQEADLIRVLDAVASLQYCEQTLKAMSNNYAPILRNENLGALADKMSDLRRDICDQRLSAHGWPKRTVAEIKASVASHGIPPNNLNDLARYYAPRPEEK